MVFLRQPEERKRSQVELKFSIALTEWNSMWEAGPLIPQVIDPKRFPRSLRWLLKVRDRNLRLVPRRPGHRYDGYAPLYHLLPGDVLRSAGLPLLKRGVWPHWTDKNIDGYLPLDFDERLSNAFSLHMWPLLNGRSARAAFTTADPIRILSHQLDFWLPYIDIVVQRRLQQGRRSHGSDDKTWRTDLQNLNRKLAKAKAPARYRLPLRGGHLWIGEEEAWHAAQELVEVADEHGALRGIVDAVKSHRISDDFSSVWSYEREDFERKLYRKRAKVKIAFVELTDTVPVYSEDTEVLENFLWGDFMTLLDLKERRIAICLRRGMTGPVDIAARLGYANHSPVSKALAKIRLKAEAFFNLN